LTGAGFQPFPATWIGLLLQWRLAAGREKFSEPYLWNYLDDPEGLPHPSHTYWMPLASLITAAGMWVTGQTSYAAGRLGFFLLAAAVPVSTASLAYAFSRRRELALVSGLLAVFSIYYVPFLPVPDNYGTYLVLGAMFLVSMIWVRPVSFLIMGALAGFMTLARSDGVLWLAMAGAVAVVPGPSRSLSPRSHSRCKRASAAPPAYRIGLVAIRSPSGNSIWLVHNLSVHGAPLAPKPPALADDVMRHPSIRPAKRLRRWVPRLLHSSARIGAAGIC
jgi:hypothetical protein